MGFFLFICLILCCVYGTNAFDNWVRTRPSYGSLTRIYNKNVDAVDYDAPLAARLAVGDIVRSGEGTVLTENPVVDDEPTVDFDPMHFKRNYGLSARVKMRSVDDVDYDAPLAARLAVGDIVRSGEGTVLTENPVVDDEPTVDFDPKKYPADAVDYDAPLAARMAVGDIVKSGEGTVLTENPVVDDEPTVDFDPMHDQGAGASPQPMAESGSLTIFTPQMTQKDIKVALSTLDQNDLVRVAAEAAQRAAGSLASATASVLDASSEVASSEEFEASKQSMSSAIDSAQKVGSGLKDSVAASQSAWKEGAGDSSKIDSTDQYMVSFIEGLKAVFSNAEVQKSSSSTISSAVSTAADLGSAGVTIGKKLGSTLSKSEKWKAAIADFSKFFSLFGTTLSLLASRAVTDRSDRELPPPKE